MQPGREVYAFSETIEHAALSRYLYARLIDLSPAMVGPENCESLLTHLQKKKTIAKTYPARHFFGIQPSLETKGLDIVSYLPGTENAADSLTNLKGDMIPCRPDLPRPLRGEPFKKNETEKHFIHH